MPILKDLKIKTNSVIRHAAAPPHSPVSAPSNHHCSCGRMQKDLGATAKEIARQEKRIQEYKDDPTREPEDVKKQEEVLAEYLAGRTDEKNRLGEFAETLSKFMVSAARQPSSRAARACSGSEHPRLTLVPCHCSTQEDNKAELDELKEDEQYKAAVQALADAKACLSS